MIANDLAALQKKVLLGLSATTCGGIDPHY